jgi:putative phosphoribosyl transferase
VRPSERVDIELLARRLIDSTVWLRAQPGMAQVPIGYFGASNGAGAALWADAAPDSVVSAVVSAAGGRTSPLRGSRPR